MTSLSSDKKITVQQCYICGERCDCSLTYLSKQIVSRGWNPIACSTRKKKPSLNTQSGVFPYIGVIPRVIPLKSFLDPPASKILGGSRSFHRWTALTSSQASSSSKRTPTLGTWCIIDQRTA